MRTRTVSRVRSHGRTRPPPCVHACARALGRGPAGCLHGLLLTTESPCSSTHSGRSLYSKWRKQGTLKKSTANYLQLSHLMKHI